MNRINNQTVLIVCRDLKSARRLRRFKIDAPTRYILASDDPRVHEAAKKYPWLDDICWIERMESFYNVAEDVIRLTETVNEWLKTLADEKRGFPEELLFFTRHVEGGMTTQRIQDLLLLIRSYRFLLDTCKINRVILIKTPGIGWEDDVLTATARSRNVGIHNIGCYALCGLIEKAKSVSEIWARSFYYTLNVLRIKVLSRVRSKKIKPAAKEIIFQLCSSAYKHVDNIVPLMKALKNNGYNPIALCWHSNERYRRETGAHQVRRENLPAEELEGWCSSADIWNSISGLFRTLRKAQGEKHKFLSHPGLSYQSVALGSLLWPSILFFIAAELPQSYRLYQALKKYFERHKPLAINLWGATVLKEGYLTWKSLDPQNNPLIFFNSVGAYIDWPYAGPNSPVDLVFIAGQIHRKIESKSPNFSTANVEVCGQARYEGIEDFKKKYSSEESRITLKITPQFYMYIFFDPGYIIRGFLAIQEQVTITNALLRFAREHPSVALIIKPHPTHKPGILESLIAGHALKNTFLIDKSELPYHALNAADMLITKYSTLGVEAMLFHCPVVTCILDGEQRFNIYEGASDYIDKIEDLEALLRKLVTDDDFLEKWHDKHMRIRKSFLAEYFCEMEEQPSMYQAKILDKELKKRANGITFQSLG